ncbi:alpha/beta hydrolase family protein [Gordonia phthalatica]|uniref:Lipase n=1 Tax=Gordonia phthalatica TaxID=1136941 RepID=A0A0N9NBP2_9ACTN|nr:lipase family protein [Gordonia phthalatica]ALG85846.1 hypothetical protein ACH46_16825 [Gordonia phthalatica]
MTRSTKLVTVIVAVLSLVACAPGSDYRTPPGLTVVPSITAPTRADQPLPEGFPRLGGVGPGALLSLAAFGDIDPKVYETGADTWRMVYRTVDPDGRSVSATGVLSIPGGTPPKGGWPLLVYTHGNTGVDYDCGPSLRPDLAKLASTVGAWLDNGYAVVVPDYQGIGGDRSSPGLPFLNAPVLGQDVINAVRAVRRATPDVTRQFAIFGRSLGATAAWGANGAIGRTELAKDLLGVVALVPPVDLTQLPQRAAAGTLMRDETLLYYFTVAQLKRTVRPTIDLGDYFRGALISREDLARKCTGPRSAEAARLLQGVGPGEVVKPTPENAARMSEALAALRPESKLTAPMYVLYGGQDHYVDPASVARALDRACGAGSVIEWYLLPLGGHENLGGSASTNAIDWVRSRFEGVAPRDFCRRPSKAAS